MTMSESLTLFRRRLTRMCTCVVASERELAHLESQFPEDLKDMFLGVTSPASAALPALPTQSPNVLVIEVDPASPGSVARLEQAALRHPDVPIIAAVENLDLNKVRKLMRLGVKDVVTLPFNADELLRVVIDVSTALPDVSANLAPMLAVAHASGGIGASTVVSHLAAAITMQDENARCCIVDLDLQFGEMASLFGVPSTTGVVDCLDAGSRMDWDIIENAVTKVRPRIDLLAAPRDIPPPEAIDADQLLTLLGMLRQQYDHVLLDCSASWTNATLSAACACTSLLVMVDQSVRSVGRANKMISLLDNVGVEQGDVRLVVNRAEKRLFQAIDVKDVGKTLKRDIAGIIPVVKSGLQEAQVRGVLLSEEEPRSPFAKAFAQLADNMITPDGDQS